jgi:hypothetical protein
MEQVAMGHVQLNHPETGGQRPMGCGAELGFDHVQLVQRQGTGNGMTHIKGYGAWRKRLPAAGLHPQGTAAQPRQ